MTDWNDLAETFIPKSSLNSILQEFFLLQFTNTITINIYNIKQFDDTHSQYIYQQVALSSLRTNEKLLVLAAKPNWRPKAIYT